MVIFDKNILLMLNIYKLSAISFGSLKWALLFYNVLKTRTISLYVLPKYLYKYFSLD